MIIKNITEQDLIKVLEKTNNAFSKNIRWNYKQIYTKKHNLSLKENNYNIKLRVNSSSGAGAHIAISERKTIHCCWHVYEKLIKELPLNCKIYTRGELIDRDKLPNRKVGCMYHGYSWESNLCLC